MIGVAFIKHSVVDVVSGVLGAFGLAADEITPEPSGSLRPTGFPERRLPRGTRRELPEASSDATRRANELTLARLRREGQPTPYAEPIVAPIDEVQVGATAAARSGELPRRSSTIRTPDTYGRAGRFNRR